MKIFNLWNLHEGEEDKEKVLTDITSYSTTHQTSIIFLIGTIVLKNSN